MLPLHIFTSPPPVLMLAVDPSLVHANSCLFQRGWGLVLPSKQRLPQSHINTPTDVLLQAVSASLSLTLSHSCWNQTITGINTNGKQEEAKAIHLVQGERVGAKQGQQEGKVEWDEWHRKEEWREESRIEGGRVQCQISCALFSHISVREHWSTVWALECIPDVYTCKIRSFRDAALTVWTLTAAKSVLNLSRWDHLSWEAEAAEETATRREVDAEPLQPTVKVWAFSLLWSVSLLQCARYGQTGHAFWLFIHAVSDCF